LQRLVLKNFRIIDANSDFFGSVIIENGIIKKIVTNDISNTNVRDITGVINISYVTIDGAAFAFFF
jgi:dihydroorotase-like cyclic amidohydrolase